MVDPDIRTIDQIEVGCGSHQAYRNILFFKLDLFVHVKCPHGP